MNEVQLFTTRRRAEARERQLKRVANPEGCENKLKRGDMKEDAKARVREWRSKKCRAQRGKKKKEKRRNHKTEASK